MSGRFRDNIGCWAAIGLVVGAVAFVVAVAALVGALTVVG